MQNVVSLSPLLSALPLLSPLSLPSPFSLLSPLSLLFILSILFIYHSICSIPSILSIYLSFYSVYSIYSVYPIFFYHSILFTYQSLFYLFRHTTLSKICQDAKKLNSSSCSQYVFLSSHQSAARTPHSPEMCSIVCSTYLHTIALFISLFHVFEQYSLYACRIDTVFLFS